MTNKELLKTIKEFQKVLDKTEKNNSMELTLPKIDTIKNTVEELKKTYPDYEILFDKISKLLNDFNIKTDENMAHTYKELNEELKKLFNRL